MRRTWVKFFVNQILRGSMFNELEIDERFVWFGFILLCGDSPCDGKICLTEDMGYTNEQIATLLKCDTELIDRSIAKLIEYDKIHILNNNIIEISKWKKYQSEYDRQKLYRKVTDKSDKKKTQSRVIKSHSPSLSPSILNKILSYLNEATGKHLRSDGSGSIAARLKEGATFEDFKKVIDIKVAKWRGQSWSDTRNPGKMVEGDDMLRPSTLFSKKHFEEYLNEKQPLTEEERRVVSNKRWMENIDSDILKKYRDELEAAKQAGDKERWDELERQAREERHSRMVAEIGEDYDKL
jgi:uncharacterized phage protein (TIGR02220 family)